MHEILVNHLEGLSLPRKSVVRLTDRPDMTLDVHRGRKQQYNNNKYPYALKCLRIILVAYTTTKDFRYGFNCRHLDFYKVDNNIFLFISFANTN